MFRGRQGQAPASACFTEAKVTTVAKIKVPLIPPSMRSTSCCRQGQDPAAATTTEVKVTACVRDKTPVVTAKVKIPIAAETKVEKTKLKKVIAKVVAGEEVETTRLATVKVIVKFPKKPPQSSLKAPKVPNSSSYQALKSPSS